MMSRGNNFSVLLSTLALFAFLLRAFIPVGFMPEYAGQSRHALVICSSSGLKTIQGAADFDTHPHNHHATCPYAVSFTQGAPVYAPLLPVVQIVSEQSAPPIENFVFNFKSKSYLSQGPPSFPA